MPTEDGFTNAEQQEAAIFEAICLEFKEYDLKENVDKMFAEIDKVQLPITVGNLLTVFHLLKNNGQLAKVETSEQKAAREHEEKQTAARQKRIDEQNANRPLTRQSHIDQDRAKTDAEKESTANAKQLFERLETMRKQVMASQAPTIYWEGGPNSGKVNWSATYDARKAAGFNPDGSRP